MLLSATTFRRGRKCLLGLSLFFLTCAATLPASSKEAVHLESPGWEVQDLAPGVRAYQRHFDDLFGGPQFVNILAIAPDASDVEIRFAAAQLLGEPRLPTSKMGKRTGAVAATNAGFFTADPDKWNTGMLKTDGVVRPFLRKESEELRFVAGGAIGIDADETLHFFEREGETWPDDLPDMVHAIAGGHLLIRNGEPHPSIEESSYISKREKRHAGSQHPRTGIAKRADGTIVLITIDGRHPNEARGVTLPEFAQFLQDLGAVDALNLDGGGSTTMWTQENGVVSRPSGNGEFDPAGQRPVRTAVVVLPRSR